MPHGSYDLKFKLGDGPTHAATVLGKSAEAKIEIACDQNMWWRYFVYKKHLTDGPVNCILCINGGTKRR